MSQAKYIDAIDAGDIRKAAKYVDFYPYVEWFGYCPCTYCKAGDRIKKKQQAKQVGPKGWVIHKPEWQTLEGAMSAYKKSTGSLPAGAKINIEPDVVKVKKDKPYKPLFGKPDDRWGHAE